MELEIYKLDDVRVIPDGDTFLVVASDLAKAWGYSAAKDITRLLDDTEKGGHVVPTPGGPQRMNVVNEKGLNRLVSTLRRPELKTWQDRLYGEIIPQWTRTGTVVDIDRVDLSDPLTVLELTARAGELAKQYRERAEQAEAELTIEKTKVIELTAPASAFDAYLDNVGDLTLRGVMKIVRQMNPNIKEKSVTGLMRDLGYIEQYNFAATAKAVHAGYLVNQGGIAKHNGFGYVQGRFTAKGVRWLFKAILGNGDARRVSDAMLDDIAEGLV